MPSIAGELDTYRNGGRSCEVLAIGQKSRADGAQRITRPGICTSLCPISFPVLPPCRISSTLLACSTNCPFHCFCYYCCFCWRARTATASPGGVAQPPFHRLQPDDMPCAVRRCGHGPSLPCRRNPGPHRLPPQAGARRSALRDARLCRRERGPEKSDRRLAASIGHSSVRCSAARKVLYSIYYQKLD
jgi:hypothetical protein